MTAQDHPTLPLADFQLEEDFLLDERPTIAVVVSLWYPNMTADSAKMLSDLTFAGIQAVRDAGGRPVLIDSADPAVQASGTQWHTAMDAFVFLGGADIHPGFFSDVSLSQQLRGVDPEADRFCISSVQRAVEDDAPLLAVCRGSQLLNVAMGGSIIQHLDDHRAVIDEVGNIAFIDETIRVEPDSKIADILGRTSAVVRGAHHQAVDQLGQDLKAVAVASDGIVEATEHASKTWVVGLQWHPEEASADLHDRARIFEALVDQAKLAVAAPVEMV